MQIETKSLLLKKPTISDTPALILLWQRKEIRKFLGGTVSEEKAKNRVADIQDHWSQHGFGQYAVFLKESSALMGLCGLHYSTIESGVEISYMFFSEHWGKGYAREAVSACLENGFNILKLEEIMGITQKANLRSCNLLKRVGMRYIKELFIFNKEQLVYKLSSFNFNANNSKP